MLRTLLDELSSLLVAEFGKGYSATNLRWFRQFFLMYGELLEEKIHHALRNEFAHAVRSKGSRIHHALRDKSEVARRKSSTRAASSAFEVLHAPRGESKLAQSQPQPAIPYTSRTESWRPGQLHANLSWTHYRTLLRIEKPDIRAFYEIEALRNNWSARELERQINSLLYERLALSRDKKGLMKLARKGHEVQQVGDIFKDPVVMEFLGLPESPKLVESDLEQALINNLQAFLLEMGKGFAFLARQQRLTLDGDHFYVDLVFYHTILKCYVLIDLKVGKLTHQNLGQLQLYVNYFDQERRSEDDNPTLGLILCTDKNDTVVRYTLGPAQTRKIFASRYQLYLPTEEELQSEIRRELQMLARPDAKPEKKRTRKP